MNTDTPSARASSAPNANLLALSALGIVFGDIGTSPLYAFENSFVGDHKLPIDFVHVMGVLSLIFWSLILVVTVKYVFITMRADNQGEGGSFALLAYIRRQAPQAKLLGAISLAALLATALFYGDAVITPAISVLSAVEGLSVINPDFTAAEVPITIGILIALFAVQSRGTGLLGRFFGPVMLVWFATIGVLGLLHVAGNPRVLLAFNPVWGVDLLLEDPVHALFVLGSVVLTITGAEALYADMGHFGRLPITRAWLFVAMPCLMLCYAGQAALVLAQPAAMNQAFFLLAPGWAIWPMLALATAATVIASQAFISAAFSITAQAVQLGFFPRITIRHTSAEERGQIYAPGVNVFLCAAIAAVTIAFPSSNALAAAFGFAVTATMMLTTLVMGYVIFRLWRWNSLWAAPVYAVLFMFDLALLCSASTKIVAGAWLPLAIAAVLTFVFLTWSRGLKALVSELVKNATPLASLLRSTAKVPRVPGLAVYFTRDPNGAPAALLHSLKHYHVLHEHVLLLTIETSLLPKVGETERLKFEPLESGFGRAALTFGYMDEPNLPPALNALPEGWRVSPMLITYVLGRQILLIPPAHRGLPLLQDKLFLLMMRLAGSATEYYRLPPGRVVELGSQVQL
jgi:KUP system potassium uptake protein